MQTHIQVITKGTTSLRDAIYNDKKLGEYFNQIEHHQKGRSPGWSRLRSINAETQGTIQIQWDPKTAILLCSVINKGDGKPDTIVGELITYLLIRFKKKIMMINIIP